MKISAFGSGEIEVFVVGGGVSFFSFFFFFFLIRKPKNQVTQGLEMILCSLQTFNSYYQLIVFKGATVLC